jgi:hypothetical protein
MTTGAMRENSLRRATLPYYNQPESDVLSR